MKGTLLFNWPVGYCEEEYRLEAHLDAVLKPYDIVIIGAGVVGCALAYHLSRSSMRVLLVDRGHDVGEGTSKGNSSIVHTGYDASPGTLESSLVTGASQSWPRLAEKLQIPFQQNGAIMVALDEEQESHIDAIFKKSLANGVEDVEVLDREAVRSMEPALNPSARSGIHVPRESIADVFQTCIACAEVALENGVDILLGFDVVSITIEPTGQKLLTSCDGKTVTANILINAAGLQSQKLARLYGGKPYDINPRRGQFLIYETLQPSPVSRILLPVPTKHTKGILVTPTIYGNLLAGPTAEDLSPDDIFATQTTPEGLDQVRQGSRKLCPALAELPVINTFAGLRANCAQGSYMIEFNDGADGIVTLNGIRSTGFTSSFALAEYIITGIEEKMHLHFGANPAAIDSRPATRRPGWQKPRRFEDQATLAAQPGYGDIVCFCEEISRQEILDALHSPLKPRTLDAIKRRTKAMKGRCQGFNCMVEIAHMIHEVCGVPFEKVTKKGPRSEILF